MPWGGVGWSGEQVSTSSQGTRVRAPLGTCPLVLAFPSRFLLLPECKESPLGESSCSGEENAGCFHRRGCPHASRVSVLLLAHLAHDQGPTQWAKAQTSVPPASCPHGLFVKHGLALLWVLEKVPHHSKLQPGRPVLWAL